MDTNISQGLTITVLGLFITFSALGFFILIMVVLKKLFPNKELSEGENGGNETVEIPTALAVSAVEEADENQDTVAAIAVAIAYLRSRSMNTLGKNLEAGRGSWWMVNRMAARQAANLLKK